MDNDKFPQLLRMAKDSIAAFAERKEATKNGVASEEVTKLAERCENLRNAFYNELRQVVGDLETDQGRTVLRDWGFYVQKAYVIGMVPEAALQFYVPNLPGRHDSEALRLTAVAYVRGIRLLGRAPQYGVNPVSAQELLDDLHQALERANRDCDVNRTQALNAVIIDLDHFTRGMRARAEARRQNTTPRQTQTQVPTEMGAALQRAQEATAETPQLTTAPRPRNTRRGR